MNLTVRCAAAGPLVLLVLAACSDPVRDAGEPETPSVAPEGTTSSPPPSVLPLPDGPLEPGRYRLVVSVECEGVEDPIACPDGVPAPPPIPLEVTVPDGWERPEGFPVVWTSDEPAGSEGFLVLGWTSNTVGVQSDPCLSRNHQLPDIQVGPGVDDFVDTVVSQPWFRGTAPVDTEVGGASGRYFTLRAPADLSRCEEWRPWDPGFFAQGPSDRWEVWVLDVGGHRVVVISHYFPATSPTTIAELDQMVRSLRFAPR